MKRLFDGQSRTRLIVDNCASIGSVKGYCAGSFASISDEQVMTTRQEIQQLRAFAESAQAELGRLIARLNDLEKRVLKDAKSNLVIGGRIRFKSSPEVVLSILRHADGPLTNSGILAIIQKDYPELTEDGSYAQRAVRNALQVLKKQGRVSSSTPQGRLRDTVWWPVCLEMAEIDEKGEAANGGLLVGKHGRVK